MNYTLDMDKGILDKTILKKYIYLDIIDCFNSNHMNKYRNISSIKYKKMDFS